MWAFVWLLQGLVASAAGVYLNSPCIRSLLRCAPFQLSLSDGKFSNAFIEDATTLNRQCRSIGPLLECMQEAVLRQCSLNISPAEKEFVKTRLFIAEICKDVDYTQKVYLRNAACINRERDWVIQACNPYDYVQLVNTSNLISLEGSCLFQKMLINCRQEAIHDKCGPDAADLYQRVKAVDMNLDFLCLESRDLRSPKFMLDIVINSYISLLLETLRPVLIMESSYLKDIVEVRQEETTHTSTKVNVALKRTKMPAHYVQDIAEYKWRRFGDIPIETSTESSSDDESSIDSADDEYLPVPIVDSVPVSTNMDPAGELEGVAMDTVIIEAGADSRLATVEETSSNFDGIIETTGLDLDGHLSTESIDVEEEAISDSAEHLNNAGSEFEQAHLNFGNSNTKVILGIHIPQFDHAEVDATLDTNVVSEAIGADLGTIQGTIMHELSDLETSTCFEEFQGMSTLCPEYLETTVTDDVEDARETTTQYPGDHETSADLGNVQNAALHSGDQEVSSANLDDVQETSTLYSDNLETTTDDLDSLQKTTTLLYSIDYFNDAAAESDALGKETRSELDDNEEHIFDTSLPPEITRANFGGESESSSPHSIISHLKGVEDFLSKDVKDLAEDDSLKLKEFLGNLAEIAHSGEFKTEEDLVKVMRIFASGMFKYILVLSSKPGWESFGNRTKELIDLYMHLKNYTADARKILQEIGTDASVVEKPTSKDLERATAENGSLDDLERKGRILEERIQEPRDFEKELDGYVSSTVVSGVIDVLGAMFAPKEIERRSVGIPRYYIKSISPEEVEGLIHMDLPGVEFVKTLVKAWDHAVDAETERLKGSTGHKKNAKFPEEPVTVLTTIKSIAELGVKLNYVLIGESYVPLEVGYVEGNEERKSNRNLKIPRRKFKFYTSTPTEPSTQLPDYSEFSTTEYPPETSTDEPESFSELDSNGKFPSDFSCPEVTGNQTPRISHLVDPEKRSRLEDCFGVLREGTQSDELPDENPEETDQEIRRSGDIKELPEKADPRNLDMETMVALRFYAEVLTELASMLPSDSPDSKTLAKRASALVDFFGNYLKAKTDPPGIVPPRHESKSGRIFQKRSLRAECADQEKPVDGECNKLKTDDGVRFDIGYSPESYIRLEMSYPAVTGMEDAYGVPVAKYIMMGETRLPLELHFTHKNVNYVHYAKVDIPKRSVDLKDHIALDEF